MFYPATGQGPPVISQETTAVGSVNLEQAGAEFEDRKPARDVKGSCGYRVLLG